MVNSEYNFFASVIINQLTYVFLIVLPYFDNFFKNVFYSFEFNNVFIFHPEYIFIFKNILFSYYNLYSTNLYISNQNFFLNESFLSPIMMFPQTILIYFLVLLFLVTYFSYFNNSVSEDNIVDHDYLAYNVTIEAEEEIGSMDDMVLTSVILLYIFL